MGRLTGKIALVTGGTAGIGLAAAQKFAEEGAFVFITGRREKELADAVALIGENSRGIQSDASKLPDLDNLYSVIQKEKGRLDVLFANAGGGEFAPLGSITEEHFDSTFNRNVKGLLFSVQKALPIFTNGGSIILNASTTASKGTEAFSVYSASKAAVRNFARSWSLDLKGRNIRVNAVSPGATETPGLNGVATSDEQREQFKTALKSMIPMGRIGRAEETAKAILFLASDDSSYMTGSELFVDGGLAQV